MTSHAQAAANGNCSAGDIVEPFAQFALRAVEALRGELIQEHRRLVEAREGQVRGAVATCSPVYRTLSTEVATMTSVLNDDSEDAANIAIAPVSSMPTKRLSWMSRGSSMQMRDPNSARRLQRRGSTAVEDFLGNYAPERVPARKNEGRLWRACFGGWFKRDDVSWELLIEQLMAVVVLMNVALMGIRFDVGPGWPGWLWMDIVFASIYVIEHVGKFLVKGVRSVYCGHDRKWAWMDLILIVLALLDIAATATTFSSFGMSMIRVVRLARITRVIRIVKLPIFGDLLMMIRGAVGGIRTLWWSVILIAIPVYALSMIMRETIGESDAAGELRESFSTMGGSFFTVFRCVVASDCNNLDGKPLALILTKELGVVYGVLYMIVTIFMTFGLFNVIASIYMENTVAAAKYNDIYQKRRRLADQAVLAEKCGGIIELVWRAFREQGLASAELMESLPPDARADVIVEKAPSIHMSREFLQDLCAEPEFREILEELDIAQEDHHNLFETLDADGGGDVDLEELLLGIANLRGDARRADTVNIRLVLRNVQAIVQGLEKLVVEKVDWQGAALRKMKASQMRVEGSMCLGSSGDAGGPMFAL